MKNILLIEHGGKFKRFTIEKLIQHDCRVFIACTEKPDWLQDLVSEDNFIITDTYNSVILLESVLAFTNSRAVKFDGVGTFWESCVVQTADIADALGLPNIGTAAARSSSQNKLLMRQKCKEAGIEMPAYAIANLNDYETLKSAAKIVGYPFVMKPLYGSSSYGVVKVVKEDELIYAIAKSKASITKNNEEVFKLFNGFVLVEQYLSGSLISVDGIIQNGVPQFVGITEFIMGPEPYFTQEGSIIKPRTVEFSKPLYDYVRIILEALKFKDGAFHCELRLDNGVPMLIEIAARMPGGPIALGYQQALGIDFVEMLADIWTGKTVNIVPLKNYSSLHKCVFPDISEKSIVVSVDGYEKAKKIIGLWDLIPISNSKAILKTYPDVPTPIYYYAVLANTEESLMTLSQQVESTITFTTESI